MYTFSCQSLLLVLSTVLPGRKFWQWPLAPDYTATVRDQVDQQPAATGVTLLAQASAGNQNYTSSEGVRMLSTLLVLPDEDSSKTLRTKYSLNLSDKNTNTKSSLENGVHLKTGLFSWSQSFCKRTTISEECLLSFCVWGHKFCKHLTMCGKIWILFNGLIWTNYNCCVNFKVMIINRSWVWRLRDVCCQLLISFVLLTVT